VVKATNNAMVITIELLINQLDIIRSNYFILLGEVLNLLF